MRGHVVVVGLGPVGIGWWRSCVAAGRAWWSCERDEAGRHLAQARALGVPVVVGDATELDVLDAANLAGATAVAVLTSDDLVNIETGLALRDQLGARCRDVPVVLRVFDRELAPGVEAQLRFRLRAVDGGAGRTVVRRRRAGPRRARHVLRRPAARSSSDG